MSALLTVIVLSIVLLAAVLWLALGEKPESPSPWELDAQACDQMRESGWSEEEIEAHMTRYGGWRHPPKG